MSESASQRGALIFLGSNGKTDKIQHSFSYAGLEQAEKGSLDKYPYGHSVSKKGGRRFVKKRLP